MLCMHLMYGYEFAGYFLFPFFQVPFFIGPLLFSTGFILCSRLIPHSKKNAVPKGDYDVSFLIKICTVDDESIKIPRGEKT